MTDTTDSAARPGPRRALSEDRILDAAIDLLDEGGPAAASIRGIAQRVGVAPNAVYTYFPDKAAVTKGVVERLLGQVDYPELADRSIPWRERLERLGFELRALLISHPGAVPLLIGGPIDGLHALTLGERLLEMLGEAGLTAEDAARASYLLIVYAFGSVALEVADEDPVGPLPTESDRITRRLGAFGATPAEYFPLSAAVVPTMAAYISTEQYMWGLRRVIDGIVGSRSADGEATPVS